MVTMRERPPSMRPRERLASGDAAGLSDAERLAVLLGTGRRGRPAVELAAELLLALGGLSGMAMADPGALMAVPGVGPAKAAQVLAAIELARRMVRVGPERRPALQTPADVYDLMAVEMSRQDREQFAVLLLDARHRLIRVCPVAVGHLTQVPAHPRDVFKAAVRHSAAAVVVVHNHPSGDPTPSPEDVALTQRLAAAGETLGIEVLDHVVIGHGRYESLRAMGVLPLSPAGAGRWGPGPHRVRPEGNG
ncbi:MAG: DNA repair protein RadC [Firmicutes bacterium]|nr:DNA repair protein RadC [Bacillota bacterium]